MPFARRIAMSLIAAAVSTAVDRKPSVNVRALAGGKVSFQVSSAGNFAMDIRDSQG